MEQQPLITTQQALTTIIGRAMQCDAVGLDTEFVWERTYYPQLGLIQIALSDEECYAIDPVEIEDLSPLGDLLANDKVIKILHDAPQDLAILKKATGAIPQNIFDTRLAAGFAGSSSTCSLSQLISELIDTDLDKSETRTNWLKRPLSEKQLSYALNDVRYLRAARVLLLSKIIGPKVKSWLQEELSLLNSPQAYTNAPDNKRYRKIKGINKISREGLIIAQQLGIWREETGRRLDRPRGHIIKDDILMAISEAAPNSIETLLETGASPRSVEKYGEEILSIIEEAKQQPPETYPRIQQRLQLNATEKKAFGELKGLITLKSDVLGLDPALIGNSNEIKGYIKAIYSGKPRQMRQTTGWRKEFLEDFYQIHRENI